MPYVNVRITPAATRDQREQIVREITETLTRVLTKRPEQTHVVIDEIAEDHWGYAGELTDTFRSRASGERSGG
ncbi:MAG: 4-oxalocrotonate tautomerase [Phycisphaerae bacterium]|nr:4-oxalocrotonate tautomerase [Phycisphaerae bacterium]